MGEVEAAASPTADRRRARAAFERRGAPCLESYFRELAERFDGGYDPASDRSAPIEDLEPPSGVFVLARLGARPSAAAR